MAGAQPGRGQSGRPQTGDPLPCLSRRERRRWRQAERRVLREREAWQLATLRNLAAVGGRLTTLAYEHSGRYAAAAEFFIDGRRIRAAPVHRPTLSALTQALAGTPAIPLLAAGRYGPYWVLTFDLTAAPLVVLAGRLSILPASPPAQPRPPHLPRHDARWGDDAVPADLPPGKHLARMSPYL
jgi:hypothetical protein